MAIYPTTIPIGNIFCVIIGVMFYGFLVPSMLTNVLEKLTIDAYKRCIILERVRAKQRKKKGKEGLPRAAAASVAMKARS
jgi:hypothetical protein